jgi:hypothetical protein
VPSGANLKSSAHLLSWAVTSSGWPASRSSRISDSSSPNAQVLVPLLASYASH